MALALGQHTVTSSTASAGLTTPAIATTSGSLVLVAGLWTQSVGFGNITDSAGNTWFKIIDTLQGGQTAFTVWAAKNITNSASHTFTLNLSGATFCGMWATEITGADTVFPIYNGWAQASAASAAAAALLTNAISVPQNGAYLAYTTTDAVVTGTDTTTWNNGETAVDSLTDTADWTGAVGLKLSLSVGTAQASATMAQSGTRHHALIAIKEATTASVLSASDAWVKA